MDTSLGLRIEGWNRDSSHHGGTLPDRRSRRGHWLIDLITALEAGDLDLARVQFAGLVQSDPTLAHHALLARIGAALQSSQLHAARHFARDLRDEGLNAWSAQAHAHMLQAAASHDTTAHLLQPAHGHRTANGSHIVDCRA